MKHGTIFVKNRVLVKNLLLSLLFCSFSLGCRPRDRGGEPEVKIIGGSPSGANPSVVALVKSSEHMDSRFCGGTLIRKDVVITAAHCVDNLEKQFLVLIGADDLSKAKKDQAAKVAEVHIHPSWNTDNSSAGNDIAILFLDSIDSEHLKNRGKPVELLDTKSNGYGQVFGWGQQSSFGFITQDNLLHVVEVPINDLEQCRKLKGPKHKPELYMKLPDSVICGGELKTGGKDTCEGDSGGPLFYGEGDDAILAGVTSWGLGCGQPGSPGVYTKVSDFKRWILESVELRKNTKPNPTANSIRDLFRHKCFVSATLSPTKEKEGTYNVLSSPNEIGSLSLKEPQGKTLSEKSHCSFDQEFSDGETRKIEAVFKVVKTDSGEVNALWKIRVGTQTYFANAPSSYDTSVYCEKDESKTSAYFTLAKDGKVYGGAQVAKTQYNIDGPFKGNSESWKTVQTCLENGIKATLLNNESSFAVRFEGHNIGQLPKIFKVTKVEESLDGKDWLRIEPRSKTEGQLLIVNSSDETWFTLELQCPFEMTLFDGKGTEYILKNLTPSSFPTTYSVQWRYPISLLGMIGPGDAKLFRYRLKDMKMNEMKKCELNRRKPRFSSSSD